MPNTLPQAPRASKPAGPAAPRPKADREFGNALLDVLAKSPMLTDAAVILTAVNELLELCEAFGENYDRQSLARDVQRAGLGRDNHHALWLAATLLKDIGGLTYNLESAQTFVSCVVATKTDHDALTSAK